jgi:hypothetical protein
MTRHEVGRRRAGVVVNDHEAAAGDRGQSSLMPIPRSRTGPDASSSSCDGTSRIGAAPAVVRCTSRRPSPRRRSTWPMRLMLRAGCVWSETSTAGPERGGPALVPRFGPRRLDAITPDELAGLVRDLRSKGLSESTSAIAIGVTNRVYRFTASRPTSASASAHLSRRRSPVRFRLGVTRSSAAAPVSALLSGVSRNARNSVRSWSRSGRRISWA